jgi:hypothetical protein
MRWYVEVTSSHGDGAPEQWVVEADHWQPALEQARRLRGDDTNLRGFSVEILDEGCRSVDPQTMAVYTVRPAPPDARLSTPSARLSRHPAHVSSVKDDAPVSSRPRVSPASPSEPPEPPASRADRIAAMLSIDGSHVSRPPAAASKPPAAAPVPQAAAPVPQAAASKPPAAAPGSTVVALDRPVVKELPSAHLVYERREDPTPKAQITYRESAWSVPPGTPADVAQRLLVGMFEGLRASLADAPRGQIINMAIFDFRFEGRPPGPPLVSLSWKDWKDKEPVVQRPSIAPGRRSVMPSKAPAAAKDPVTVPDVVPPRTDRRRKRLSGEELIASLFESMHEVHFVRDSLSGAKFILSLILEKLPSDAGMVHFFDINTLEFVVVRAVGKGSGRVLLCRTPEKDLLVAPAFRLHRSVVVADAKEDARLTGARWGLLNMDVRSVVVAPVEQGGRFLGLIELVNPRDGGVFSEGDGHGLTYLGEQFAEFLAARGLLLDPERIEKG